MAFWDNFSKFFNYFIAFFFHKRQLFFTFLLAISSLKIVQYCKNWVFEIIKLTEWLVLVSNKFEPLPKLFEIFGLFICNFKIHWFDWLNKIYLLFQMFVWLNFTIWDETFIHYFFNTWSIQWSLIIFFFLFRCELILLIKLTVIDWIFFHWQSFG